MKMTVKFHVLIALMMEAVRTPETSVYFNETTRRYIPENPESVFWEVSQYSGRS
jgi:hypothetical protein